MRAARVVHHWDGSFDSVALLWHQKNTSQLMAPASFKGTGSDDAPVPFKRTGLDDTPVSFKRTGLDDAAASFKGAGQSGGGSAVGQKGFYLSHWLMTR